MKPIRLVVAGLHSFREAQEIRFDELAQTGVFGIFGPTGSGKSTILDAMTLALYGTVGRADHNTRGILNHAENTLSVLLEFEIGVAPERILYRVERSYKRKDEVAVQNVRSRLTASHPQAEEEVLADKDSDVTARVKEVLGLEPEDFTRAVVLPQGKFAEFLNLKGSDRNKMLQRLFSLERYGDRLNQRAKERFETSEHALAVVSALQQGLGDASPEAVIAAGERLNAAQQAETVAKQRLDETRARYEQLRGVWQGQMELAKLETALAQHLERAHEIERLDASLEQAERAERVMRILTGVEEAQAAYTEAVAVSTAAEAETARLKAVFDEASEAHRVHKRELESQTPELITRQKQLQDAEQVAVELSTLQQQLERLQREQATRMAQKETAAAALQQVQADHKELQTKIASAQMTLKDFKVSSDTRSRFATAKQRADQAVAALQQHDAQVSVLSERSADRARAEAALIQAQQNAQTSSRACKQLQEELAQVGAQAPVSDEALNTQTRDLDRLAQLAKQLAAGELQLDNLRDRRSTHLHQGQQLTAVATELWSELEVATLALEHLKQARMKREWENLHVLAGKIAHSLQPGEPCPVCGSREHPQPSAGADEPDIAGIAVEMDAELAKAEQAQQTLRARLDDHQAKVVHEEAAVSAVEQQIKESEVLVQTLSNEIRSVHPDAPVDSSSHLLEWLADQTESLAQSKLAYESWRNTLARLEASVRHEEVEVHRGQAAVAAATVQVEASVTEELRQRALTDAAHAQFVEKTNEFNAMFATLPTALGDTLEEKVAWLSKQLQQIARFDAEAEQVQARLEDMQRQLQQGAVQSEELRVQTEQLTVQLAQTDVALETCLAKVAERDREFQTLTGGTDIQRARKDVAERFTALQQAVNDSEAAHESALQQLQAAERAATSATTRLEGTADRLAKVREELAVRMAEEQFVSIGEVMDARLDAAQRETRLEQVTTFKQSEQKLRIERDAVLAALGNERITEADWDTCGTQLAQATETWRAAIGELDVAVSVKSDVEQRHQQWLETETERIRLSEDSERLGVLRQVLSGNRFVEFIAQEQLDFVAQHASNRLKQLTRGRYALEVASDGRFVMRDDYNGGVRRPASTLSGGETFLTSLALALSLSTQIQLRGKYPLEFFFLDEGFGTLDADLLDVVMSTLEKLHLEHMTIGVISHVPELQQRLQRRLIVEPAEQAGRGTRVRVELA